MESVNAEEVFESSNKQQGRSRTSSTSSGESDSTNENESGVDSEPRPAKRVRRVSDLKYDFLSQQVAFLTNLITQSQANKAQPCSNDGPSSLVLPVPNNSSGEGIVLQPPGQNTENTQLNIAEYATVIKDPIYPKSNEIQLKRLEEIQHFKTENWHSIRFSEAQKKYISTPGFIELKTNEELRRFEPPNEDHRLYLLERSFAAMTNAMLVQKDTLRNALQNLIIWSGDKETTLTPSSLFEKVQQIFNKESEFMKVSEDLLQITCGRRADFIRLRREMLLKQIPDEFISVGVQKIPPSSEHLFDTDLLGNYLQKIGGAEKLSSGPTSIRTNWTNHSNNASTSSGYRGTPSTSKTPKDKTFRSHGNQKSKSNQFKRNKGKNSNAKPVQQSKGKAPRSHSPPKNRNRRA